jgi:hypothetical protein
MVFGAQGKRILFDILTLLFFQAVFLTINFSVMTSLCVIPTQAKIQITYWYNNAFMDSCFHGNDILKPYHGKIYSKKKFGPQNAYAISL